MLISLLLFVLFGLLYIVSEDWNHPKLIIHRSHPAYQVLQTYCPRCDAWLSSRNEKICRKACSDHLRPHLHRFCSKCSLNWINETGHEEDQGSAERYQG
jgi:hypothetical protein